MKNLDNWLILISGFLQKRGKPGNGFTGVWSDARERFPDARVELCPWRSDWSDVAEFVTRFAPKRVVVAGYSWGGGYGARTLAREFKRRGVRINELILADAVFRSPTIFGRWRALMPNPVISFPSNIDNAVCFRQFQSLPAGHDVMVNDEFVPCEPVAADHQYVDNAPAVKDAILTTCDRLFSDGQTGTLGA